MESDKFDTEYSCDLFGVRFLKAVPRELANQALQSKPTRFIDKLNTCFFSSFSDGRKAS